MHLFYPVEMYLWGNFATEHEMRSAKLRYFSGTSSPLAWKAIGLKLTGLGSLEFFIYTF